MSKHTPLRWYTSGGAIFQVGTGAPITDELRPGDAEFIVRACNVHDEFVVAISALMRFMEESCPCPDDFHLYKMCSALLATARGAGSEDA